MLRFQPITLRDAEKIGRYLSLAPSKQLVACFEAFYLWRDVLQVEWAEYEGFAIFRVCYEPGVPTFLFPFGAGDPTGVLLVLNEYQKRRSAPLRLSKVRPEQLPLLPGDFTATASRDRAEYLYDTDIFRTYTGKALQPKRNFVNYARTNFDWRYEAVTADNLTECQEFASRFDGDDSFNDDSAALRNALTDWENLSLTGGLLRTDGAIAALFVCTLLSDGETAAGLFLRGDHTKKGVIPLLYQIYFLHHTEFKYFNFGEDLGVEGLRKNKLSFQPAEMLELYDIEMI
jgi:hypothetical protein